MDPYRTLTGRGSASLSIQGSEFIGYAVPVESLAAAEDRINEIRESHSDATHNVPAYRIRRGDEREGNQLLREYSSDAGEPSGSAGKPILNVLQGEALENVVVVVTRYFGGTELGVGGLVRAYSGVAGDAIESAGIVEHRSHERLTVIVEYDDSGTVRSVLESAGVEFDATYETNVTFEVRVPLEDGHDLRDRILSATSGRAELT